MQLRDYQLSAVNETVRQLWQNTILVAPTGAGKTVMGAEIVRRLGAPTLWVAHRRELIHQAAKSLERLGLYTGTIMAGEHYDMFARVQVASIQTLRRRDVPDVKLIIVDECHHAPATSYDMLFDLGVPVVGLTATPYRLDGKPLGDSQGHGFGSLVVAAQSADLVERGYLIAPKVYCTPGRDPDLSNVRITAGEYNLRDLEKVMDDPDLIGDIVTHWKKRASWGRTLCFATDVKHSRDIVQMFNDSGVPSAHLDGNTPQGERDQMLKDLASAKLRLISNCLVVTEGYDLPALSCIIVARPTQSLQLHMQMIGRVMRPAEQKTAAIVLDHAGNHHTHGAVTQRLEFSLDSTVKRDPEALGLRRCDDCGLMFDAAVTRCPDCGAEHEPVVRELVHDEGELTEFEDESFAYRSAFFQRIEAERLMNDRKPGWSFFRFEERFGVKPTVVYPEGEDDAGELVDGRSIDPTYRQRIHGLLLDQAEERGYKPGWASYRFKDIFGVMPRGFVMESRLRRLAPQLTARLNTLPPPPSASDAVSRRPSMPPPVAVHNTFDEEDDFDDIPY